MRPLLMWVITAAVGHERGMNIMKSKTKKWIPYLPGSCDDTEQHVERIPIVWSSATTCFIIVTQVVLVACVSGCEIKETGFHSIPCFKSQLALYSMHIFSSNSSNTLPVLYTYVKVAAGWTKLYCFGNTCPFIEFAHETTGNSGLHIQYLNKYTPFLATPIQVTIATTWFSS